MAQRVKRAQKAAPYRGEDRRRIAGPLESPFGRPYLLAAIVIVLIAAGLVFGLQVATPWVPSVRRLAGLLQAASLVVAIAVAGLAFTRWFLTSDAPALWIGVALTLYGTLRLGVAELVPMIVPSLTANDVTVWIRPASQIIIVLLLLRAATIMPVSTDVSGPRLITTALVATIVLAGVVRLVPAIASFIDGAPATLPRSYGVANNLGVMPFALGILGLGFVFQGRRLQRWLFAWLGLALLTLATADVVRVAAAPPVQVGLMGKEVLRLMGLLLALNGATREILYTYRDSSTRLAKSEYTAQTAQERIRAGQAAAEERAHEARSALAAIEGATRTLEHYRDRLPPETQAALSTAVSGEIRRLQRLVSVENPESALAPFSLAESLAPIVASERARGVDVDVDVAGDLNVIGRAAATEQVMQTLFDNARRYAPGSTVTVRGSREGDWAVLRVEDRGPGVPASERETIFRRGVRGDASGDVAGSGLGLYVAVRLMLEQSGDLWVDHRSGGGASFALALRLADSAGAEEPIEGVQKSGKITDSGDLRTAGRSD